MAKLGRAFRVGIPALLLAAAPGFGDLAQAQQAVVSRDANVRSDYVKGASIVGQVAEGDTVQLLGATMRRHYYHVETGGGTTGWVYGPFVQVLGNANPAVEPTTPAPAPAPPQPNASSSAPLEVAGSKSFAGCGDGLWTHVYNPSRLIIHQRCVTVTGTIVDASNGKHADGVRHEADGDTHGWLRLDPQFTSMINAGNRSNEGGNLVFEIVCHFGVTQSDATSACAGFNDHTTIPPVGSHIRITGTYVLDTNHGRWNEIHPVSSMTVIP